MPKASMDENSLLAACEYQVRLADQISSVKPVAIAHAMNQFTDGQFWAGILPTDKGHPGTALGLA